MSAATLIYPMAAMVLLTFAVLVTLFRTRAGLVSRGQLPATYFRAYEGAEEPDTANQLSRYFINLFEAPVLFYAVCLAGIAIGITAIAFHVLAWLYVGLRVIHAYIHTGRNDLRPRIAAYFSSWFVLLAMWAYLAMYVAGGAG